MTLMVVSGVLVTLTSAVSYSGLVTGSISEVGLLVCWGASLLMVAKSARPQPADERTQAGARLSAVKVGATNYGLQAGA